MTFCTTLSLFEKHSLILPLFLPHPSTHTRRKKQQQRQQSLSEMVKAGGVLVCILIIGLDIAAGILGLEAEVEQNKEKHLRLWLFECREPSPEAFRLGLGAAALLSLAHILANLLGGCTDCICTQDELQKASSNRQLSMACLVFTWIILAVGLSLLVIGTLANHKSRASCGFTHHHFFSIGGVVCFVHALFCVAYYVSATATEGR